MGNEFFATRLFIRCFGATGIISLMFQVFEDTDKMSGEDKMRSEMKHRSHGTQSPVTRLPPSVPVPCRTASTLQPHEGSLLPRFRPPDRHPPVRDR